MKVNLNNKTIYNNQLFKKGLEFAADRGYLFNAGASLALSTVARPLSILAAPKTDKENKKIACVKSLSSSGAGFLLMLAASMPLTNGIRCINKNPAKYLNPKTIKNLKDAGKPLTESKGYQFATQIFKLGLGLAIAAPKAIITCAFMPHVIDGVDKIGSKKKEQAQNKKGSITFKGGAKLDPIGKQVGKIIDKPWMQNFANKFKNSNYEMHIPVLTDIVATWAFIHQNNKSKKIEPERKKVLNYNTAISTGLCIGTSYVVDKVLNKPTEKFIKKFSEVNKSDPKLAKYVEGIKIVKPAMIMGGIYYIAIPLISTFLADRVGGKGIKEVGKK